MIFLPFPSNGWKRILIFLILYWFKYKSMASYIFCRIELVDGYSFKSSTPNIEFALDTNPYVSMTSSGATSRNVSATVGFGGAISSGNHTVKIRIPLTEMNPKTPPGFFYATKIGVVSILTNNSDLSRPEVAGLQFAIDYYTLNPNSTIYGYGTLTAP